MNCPAEVKNSCAERRGKGEVAMCMWQLSQDKSVNAVQMSVQCRSAIRATATRMQQSLRLNPIAEEACADDAEELCDDARRSKKEGEVMRCLKRLYKNEKLGQQCSSAIKMSLTVAAVEYGADAFRGDCASDAAIFCGDMFGGEVPTASKMHECLRQNLDYLEKECREAEFLQASLEEKDLDLKPNLKRLCALELDAHCPATGRRGRELECLQHALPRIQDTRCKRAVAKDAELTNQDYRLKYGITAHCMSDIDKFCAAEKAEKLTAEANGGTSKTHGAVLTCLGRHQDKLRGACHAEVRKIVSVQAEDWKAHAQLKAVCQGDVDRFCDGIEPGHGKVHDCLMANFNELDQECARVEFTVQESKATDTGIQARLSSACGSLFESNCAGAADVVSCLATTLKTKGAAKVGRACASLVQHELASRHRDYRLDPIISRACKVDINSKCLPGGKSAPKMSGEVYSCLITRRKELSRECQSVVHKRIVERTRNPLLSPQYKGSCERDIAAHCPDVKTGTGELNKCLQKAPHVSPECKSVVSRYTALKAEDVDFAPGFQAACGKEMPLLCGNFEEDDGDDLHDAFFCLVDQSDSPLIGPRCRHAIEDRSKLLVQSFHQNPHLVKACGEEMGPTLKEKRCMNNGLDCLWDKFLKMELSTDCTEVALMTAKLVTLKPLRYPVIEHSCGAELEQCEKFCSQAKESRRGECQWVCLRKALRSKASMRPQCREPVLKVMSLRNFDVRLNRKVAKACLTEIATLCDRNPGAMRVLACLRALGSSASEACDAAVNEVSLESLTPDVKRQYQDLVALERANLFDSQFVERGVLDFIEIRGPLAYVAALALAAVATAFGYLAYQRYTRRHYTVFVTKD